MNPKAFLKRFIKNLVYRPTGVTMGIDSLMMIPRWIHNPTRITIGSNCYIGRFSVLHPLESYALRPLNGRIKIDDNVYIGGHCQIHAMDFVEIGSGCVLSEHVYVSDIAHGLDPRGGPIMEQPLESKGPVRIGKNVFIGYGCSILPGVTLGDHCIVGTRSVVTHSFPAYSMIAGCPARVIKKYNPITGQWDKLASSN